MEHMTVAGHPEPLPAAEVAVRLLQQLLETAREKRGADAADALEALVGARLGTLIGEGLPSIDVATMRRAGACSQSRATLPRWSQGARGGGGHRSTPLASQVA